MKRNSRLGSSGRAYSPRPAGYAPSAGRKDAPKKKRDRLAQSDKAFSPPDFLTAKQLQAENKAKKNRAEAVSIRDMLAGDSFVRGGSPSARSRSAAADDRSRKAGAKTLTPRPSPSPSPRPSPRPSGYSTMPARAGAKASPVPMPAKGSKSRPVPMAAKTPAKKRVKPKVGYPSSGRVIGYPKGGEYGSSPAIKPAAKKPAAKKTAAKKRAEVGYPSGGEYGSSPRRVSAGGNEPKSNPRVVREWEDYKKKTRREVGLGPGAVIDAAFMVGGGAAYKAGKAAVRAVSGLVKAGRANREGKKWAQAIRRSRDDRGQGIVDNLKKPVAAAKKAASKRVDPDMSDLRSNRPVTEGLSAKKPAKKASRKAAKKPAKKARAR